MSAVSETLLTLNDNQNVSISDYVQISLTRKNPKIDRAPVENVRAKNRTVKHKIIA